MERCFSKLKQFRAVATRYDKRDYMYQGTVDVAFIRIWLRDPVPDLRNGLARVPRLRLGCPLPTGSGRTIRRDC